MSYMSIKIQIHVTYFNACAIQMLNLILKIQRNIHDISIDGKDSLLFAVDDIALLKQIL